MRRGASQSGTRVCHVIERLAHAGAESMVRTLAIGMRSTPYAPLVCCAEGGPLVSALERRGVVVECLNLPRLSVTSGRAFASFAWRLVSGLREVVARHDVALLHGHMQDAILWSAAAGVLERTAIVGTYHGLNVLPKNRSHLDPRNGMRRMLYRWAGRVSDCTIAVSPAVRELLCSRMGLPEHKTVTLLNGIDTRQFAEGRDDGRIRRELGLTGRRVLVCVGRLAPAKGQAVLLEAFVHVARRVPDAALLLVGDGPERDALQARASTLGLSGRVVVTPHRSDIPDVLALAELFVMPSFSEGISLSLLEALASGKPVVATDVQGNLEVLGEDGAYARLVPPRDADALTRVIASVLDNPDAARDMARRGQARARERFDLQGVLAATAGVYERVLEARRSRRRRSA